MTKPTTGLGSGRPHPWVKVARFLALIDQNEDGCWGWRGSVASNGYGKYGQWWAHRLAYELLVGPIPHGHEVDHVAERGCTQRTCTRPDHLEAITPAENRRRQPNVIAQMARTHCPKGHAYEGSNLMLKGKSRTKRDCRTCHNERVARRKRARRERG